MRPTAARPMTVPARSALWPWAVANTMVHAAPTTIIVVKREYPCMAECPACQIVGIIGESVPVIPIDGESDGAMATGGFRAAARSRAPAARHSYRAGARAADSEDGCQDHVRAGGTWARLPARALDRRDCRGPAGRARRAHGAVTRRHGCVADERRHRAAVRLKTRRSHACLWA